MSQQNQKIDWVGIQRAELKSWYFVSKIMGTIIPGNFPYYTFDEIRTQINEDPAFKQEE
jgi:hypothetical protein